MDNPHRPNQTYIPQIYIKLKDWHPPPASLNTENRITLFEKNVRQAVELNNHKQHPYTNLTSVQREVLKQLKQSKDLVILPTDKNLGPAILNRDQYITQVLSEHLLTLAYLQLSKETAINKLENTKQLLVIYWLILLYKEEAPFLVLEKINNLISAY